MTTAADARRQKIVASAAALFDEHGYDRASMGDVAAAVGIAKPTLYHYFASKDAILVEIHAEFIQLLHDTHDARVAAGITDPRELLLGVMTDICDLMRTHRSHVRVFFEHHRQLPEVERKELRGRRDDYFHLVREQFVRGNDGGIFDCDPDLAAMAMFGMCNWAYQWFSAGGTRTPAEIARNFHDMLLRGVLR